MADQKKKGKVSGAFKAVYFILMTRICIVPTVTAVTAMRTDAPAGSMM